MAAFLNTPAGAADTEANAKAATALTAAPTEPQLNYDNANDLGLNQEERTRLIEDARAPSISNWQSVKAGAKASVLGATLTKINAPSFTPDNNFDAARALQADARTKEMLPDEDEIQYLQNANSLSDYDYRWGQIPQTRRDVATAAANPISGLVGTIGADAPSMLIPFVGEGALGRTGATALRILADTYDVGSSIYSADQLGQSPLANAMVAGTGILDMTHLLQRGIGRVALRSNDAAVNTAADAVETEAAQAGTKGAAYTDPATAQHLDETGVTNPVSETKAADHTEGAVDPDQPTMPQSTRDLEDDLATVDTIPDTTAPEAVLRDYSAEKIDYAGIHNSKGTHNRVRQESDRIADLGTIAEVAPAIRARIEALGESAQAPAYYRQILDQVVQHAGDTKVHIDASPNFRARFSHYLNGADAGDIRLPAPHGAKRAKVTNAQQLIDSMQERELRAFLHESIHAATSRGISLIENYADRVTPSMRKSYDDAQALRTHLNKQLEATPDLSEEERRIFGYYLSNVHEMFAGLGDNRQGYTSFLKGQRSISGKESALRKLTKSIAGLIGIKAGTRSGFTDVVDQLHDFLGHQDSFDGLKKSQAVPEYSSDTMRGAAQEASAAYDEAVKTKRSPDLAAAKATLSGIRKKFNQFFALRDDIARGGAEHAAFADRIVSDATNIGERRESAVDVKRLLKSQMDSVTGIVENAISNELARTGAATKVDQFFYTKHYVQARKDMEQRLTNYLDYAHGEAKNGRTPEAPDADIERVVKAYTESGWAEGWHDHISNINSEAGEAFERTPYYLPRRYNADKLQRVMRERGLENKDIIDIFSQALRDTYPTMDRDLSRQVARTWHQSLTSAQPRQGAMWRRAVNGLSNDEFVDMLMENGVHIEDAQKILEDATFSRQATGSNSSRNLRKRNALDMQKEYESASGRSMRLADIQDSDVTKLMNQYNNRMAGRLGLHQVGYSDLKDLSNDIDILRAKLTEDRDGWTTKVDDTIDSIMGYPPRGDTPDALLGSGYLSNALMLKNPALYQLTDLALSAKEFGMYRVVRAMMQGGLFRHARVELGNNATLHARLNNVLNGSVQNDMRFRWLHSYAEDNTDLTRSAQWVNVARNLSQAAYTANGMRLIHRAMVNMNAGLVRDSIEAALQGSEKDAALLKRFGLREEALGRMRKAYTNNPDEIFTHDLQQHIESVGQRFMDYVVQQNRTGETSHFAEMNPIGRVLIGYQAFAFAGTNKILRRHTDNGEYLGLAMLIAYQFPMMALATYAKYGMDGTQGDKTTKDLVTDSIAGMSAIGGASMVMDLFNNRAGGGVSMLGGFNSIISTLQSVESKGKMSMQDASKLIPLAQEFIPLRILINNLGDDQ